MLVCSQQVLPGDHNGEETNPTTRTSVLMEKFLRPNASEWLATRHFIDGAALGCHNDLQMFFARCGENGESKMTRSRRTRHQLIDTGMAPGINRCSDELFQLQVTWHGSPCCVRSTVTMRCAARWSGSSASLMMVH